MNKSLPMVEGLFASKWAGLDAAGRLSALQEMESQMAIQECRAVCDLELIPPDVLSQGTNAENLKGRHLQSLVSQSGELISEKIQLNPKLLGEEQPYSAVETYFHEARHSYQDHVADHPELAENSQQAADFYKAKNGGYLYKDDTPNPVNYRCQPSEIDANNTGQSHTGQLYEQFGELSGYLKHQESPAYESARIGFAVARIPAFQEQAREAVDDKYERAQAALQSQHHALSSESNGAFTSDDGRDKNLVKGQDEEYDYSQGNGY